MVKIYGSILVGVILFFWLGGLLYPYSPYEINPKLILLPPSLDHPFGTDRLGRDLVARVIEGGSVSLVIGFLSATITSFLGLIIGITAGYLRGKVDFAIVVIIDLFLTFPTFFLLLALVSYIEASVVVLVIVLSITGWMGMARLIRSESFAIGKKPYIKILKLGNLSNITIILKYFTPLLAPIFLVSFTFGVGGAILGESGLSFLGLGINPPQMSLGTILSDGKEVIDIAPWVSFFPGFFILVITYCLVHIADFIQHKTNTKTV